MPEISYHAISKLDYDRNVAKQRSDHVNRHLNDALFQNLHKTPVFAILPASVGF